MRAITTTAVVMMLSVAVQVAHAEVPQVLPPLVRRETAWAALTGLQTHHVVGPESVQQILAVVPAHDQSAARGAVKEAYSHGRARL